MKKNEKHAGFTLIEVLVAVLLAGILISAIYQVMVNQNRVYIVEEQNIEIQQNARAALDFMARELRLAGFGVPDDDDPATNVFPSLINNADGKTVGIAQGTDAIIFTASVGYGSWVAQGVNPDSLTNTVKVYPATDPSFEFEESTSTSDVLVDLIAYHGDLKLKLNETPLKITNVTGPTTLDPLTTLTFDTPISQALIDEAKGKGLVEGDQVVLCPQTVRYSVHEGVLKRSLSNDGGVASWPTVQPLINNVEDLQLSYSFDDSDDDHKADMDYPVTETDPPPCVIQAVDAASAGILDRKILSCGKTALLKSVAYRSNTTVVSADDEVGDPSGNPLRGVELSLVVRSSRQNPDHRFRRFFVPLAVQDHDPCGHDQGRLSSPCV